MVGHGAVHWVPWTTRVAHVEEAVLRVHHHLWSEGTLLLDLFVRLRLLVLLATGRDSIVEAVAVDQLLSLRSKPHLFDNLPVVLGIF